MYNPIVHHILRRRGISSWFGMLLAIVAAVTSSGCGHSSTSSRIRRLTEQEARLRSSVDTLEARQRELRGEIQRSEAQAALARCQASQASYRAAVASVFSEYSATVAEYKGCQASAAKEGGAVMAVGCGLATFLTGGWALAVCGGSLLAGATMSDSCSGAPPQMTTADIHRIAREKTGLSGAPQCGTPTAAGRSRGSLHSPNGEDRRAHAERVGGPTVGLFHVPTRKEARRERAAERKQSRIERKEHRAAEKQRKRVNRKIDRLRTNKQRKAKRGRRR